MEHQDPERRQLWHDPLTNEQWFGVVATDTEQVPDAAAEKMPADGPVKYLYAWADHSYVHLEVTGRDATPTRLRVGADVVPGAERTDYRLDLDRDAGTATWEVRRALDPIRLDTDQSPYRPDADAPWHLYSLITNRAQAGRPAEYDEVGRLRRGSWDPTSKDYDSRATWSVDTAHDTVRVRLPWSMLGLADPSSRLALGEGIPAALVTIPASASTSTSTGTPRAWTSPGRPGTAWSTPPARRRAATSSPAPTATWRPDARSRPLLRRGRAASRGSRRGRRR